MTEKQQYQRKKVYIDPKFQRGAIIFYLVLAIISILQVFYFGWNNFDIVIREAEKLNLGNDHPFIVLMTQLKSSYVKLFLLSSVATLVGFIIGGLYFTHRIAGPIYKMKKHLAEFRESGAKKDTPIRLRDGDYFNDLADEINLLLEKVKGNSKF